MLKNNNSRRSFLKGLSSLGVGGLIASQPLMAAGIDSTLTANISKIILANYPHAKAFQDVVKTFAESLQKDATPQMESPLFLAKATAQDLASYVTVQFTLSTNILDLSAGKADKLILL